MTELDKSVQILFTAVVEGRFFIIKLRFVLPLFVTLKAGGSDRPRMWDMVDKGAWFGNKAGRRHVCRYSRTGKGT